MTFDIARCEHEIDRIWLELDNKEQVKRGHGIYSAGVSKCYLSAVPVYSSFVAETNPAFTLTRKIVGKLLVDTASYWSAVSHTPSDVPPDSCFPDMKTQSVADEFSPILSVEEIMLVHFPQLRGIIS